MLKNAVFLDRDGVINRDSRNYIKSWEEFEFLPGSLEAIADLTQHGFPLFIISNQSAVGRRLMAPSELERIFRNMCQIIESYGGQIRDIFYCPHRPENQCDCRKPKPGLIFRAREKYDIDLSSSVMVGDSLKDIACAQNAGCGFSIWVKTGREKITGDLSDHRLPPTAHIAADLRHAADWIISHLTDLSAADDHT